MDYSIWREGVRSRLTNIVQGLCLTKGLLITERKKKFTIMMVIFGLFGMLQHWHTYRKTK